MQCFGRVFPLLGSILLIGHSCAFGASADEPGASPPVAGSAAAPAAPVAPATQNARAAAAADALARAEAKFGKDSPGVLSPVIDLAALTLAAGDADGADALLQRARALLAKYPDQDPQLRLRLLVLQSDRLVSLGSVADSNELLYKALDLARSVEAIGPLSEANVLDRLAANARQQGRTSRGSTFSNQALDLREQHYGKDSAEFAAARLKLADWYREIGDLGREIDQEEKALAILEKQYGVRDRRLAIPLIRLATARIAQRRHRVDAERILQRAMGLDFGQGLSDAYLRGEVLATTGDLQVVFGKAEDSTPLYAQAWQAIASHGQLGAPAANRYFGRVRQLYLAVPDEIANIGTVDLAYSVTPVGTVDEVRILENAVPAINSNDQTVSSNVGGAMWTALRRSRYRPRVIDGAPVTTAGLTFSSEFCLDLGEIVPLCKARANASVTR